MAALAKVLRMPIVYLNHDQCPECGNISIPRPDPRRNCAALNARQCVECGATVEVGAIESPADCGV